MTVRELRDALKGLSGKMPVAMADEMAVIFAAEVDGVFVISDIAPHVVDPVKYWEEE